jgi:nucleotide-binding universal stress UspA family protein
MAPASVLVVRSDVRLDPAADVQRILVPTDFSESSALAIEQAAEIAKRHGAEIDLLHSYAIVVPLGLGSAPSHPGAVSAAVERVRTDALRLLEGIKIKVEAQGVTAQIFLTPEVAVRAILDTAARRRSDLIVMGTHVRSGVQRLLGGSTVQPVVRRSPCPVLAVSAPEPAHEKLATETSGSSPVRS